MFTNVLANMIYLHYYILLIISIYCAPVANVFHGFERPCRDSSPGCLQNSIEVVLPDFVGGIPELGIRSLNPFDAANLLFVLPKGITIEIEQVYTGGLRTCRVVFARKIAGDQYEAQLRCNLSIDGVYISKGKINFSIDGEGQSVINCNLTINCYFRILPMTKPDGDLYLQVEDFKLTNKLLKGQVSFSLYDFITGDPEMSSAVLNFLNENWSSLLKII